LGINKQRIKSFIKLGTLTCQSSKSNPDRTSSNTRSSLAEFSIDQAMAAGGHELTRRKAYRRKKRSPKTGKPEGIDQKKLGSHNQNSHKRKLNPTYHQTNPAR
jgi:hypothetical protein